MPAAGPVQRRLSPILITLGMLGVACQRPAEDLREWQATDHRHTSNTGATEKGQTAGTAAPRADGLDDVSITTWQTKCVVCHGRVGQGDGPQAMVFKPRDLTDPAWQSSVTDEQILTSIQKGKEKMPGFALPDTTARKLVALVRRLGEIRQPVPSASASGTAPTPGATVAPSGAVAPPRTAAPAPGVSAAPAPAASASQQPLAPSPSAQVPEGEGD